LSTKTLAAIQPLAFFIHIEVPLVAATLVAAFPGDQMTAGFIYFFIYWGRRKERGQFLNMKGDTNEAF